MNERSNSTDKVSFEGEAIDTRIEGEAITAENIMDILGKIIRQNFLMTTKGMGPALSEPRRY